MLRNFLPSLNAATRAGLAGVAILISPPASRVGIARESSVPRCSARSAMPVGGPYQTTRGENFWAHAGRSPLLDQNPVKHAARFRFRGVRPERKDSRRASLEKFSPWP